MAAGSFGSAHTRATWPVRRAPGVSATGSPQTAKVAVVRNDLNPLWAITVRRTRHRVHDHAEQGECGVEELNLSAARVVHEHIAIRSRRCASIAPKVMLVFAVACGRSRMGIRCCACAGCAPNVMHVRAASVCRMATIVMRLSRFGEPGPLEVQPVRSIAGHEVDDATLAEADDR